MSKKIENIIDKYNKKKILFTAGPASLVYENVINLKPCFGRGDKEYLKTEKKVLKKIKKIAGGFDNIARFQGSGSLAIEIMISNFMFGNVLVVDTGYYSDRLYRIANDHKNLFRYIKNVKKINWRNLDKVNSKFDWVIACPTETSCGLKLDIRKLKKFSTKLRSKLMLDATGSIGLERHHELADVISFSSCKGLFGLTGAGFICFNKKFSNSIPSFYLNLNNHLEKKMTGPYQIIYSLEKVLDKYSDLRQSVIINKKKFVKKMRNYLSYPIEFQPNLCTHVSKKLSSKSKNVVLYTPRNNIGGSVVCHLGEAHLGKNAKGNILDLLY
tara:strand:- start:1926 stop:2906 length:981 start_codon:yes stop_codon:yes gene_type:complete